MPYYGGASPSPRRYGGGIARPNKPLLQVVHESLAAQRGSAYDQVWPPQTIVGIENMATARALTFDGYEASTRLANNFLPSKMSALLSRWEGILAVPPNPGDSEPTRRARVAAAMALMGQPNSVQLFIDAVTIVLGPIFTGVVHFTPANALSWWPGNSGTAAQINNVVGVNAQFLGLANVPTAAYGALLTVSNCTNAVNNSTSFITARVGPTSVTARGPAWVTPDNGVGGTLTNPTIHWSISNPAAPWYSTIDNIAIQCQIPAGYAAAVVAYPNPNALWFATVAALNKVLDAMLPGWVTWEVFFPASSGLNEFRVDEHDLDFEVLGL